ncbi:hypothetical protein SELMODRAFT_407142 [Selaginella moellendorffii]|uniref:Protein kinase domain-containing protein n=1 Tax=Selaginella moellendorffii TaxID=88036 RepID=D8R419_SELML|nr:hypothetical protein SELMODRAFT_407142 [Selaginella moellendorffii]
MKVLGRYNYAFGYGESSAVAHGYDDLGERVVIKNMGKGEEVHKQILKEFEIMVNCKHENVLDVIDMGLDKDGNYYMVFEHTDGNMLEYLEMDLSKAGKESELGSRFFTREEKIKEIMRQLLLGLAWLHERGVAHQGMTKDNVLVKVKGCDFKVKLSDFSCARRLCNNPPETTLKVGTAEDIWSAGILLAGMLLPLEMPELPEKEAKGEVLETIKKFLRDLDDLIKDKDALELVKSMLASDPVTARQALAFRDDASRDTDVAPQHRERRESAARVLMPPP